MKAEGSAKDGAAFARLHGKNNLIEFFHHRATSEHAQVTSGARAIGIAVRDLSEGLSVFQCGKRRLNASARFRFRMRLVDLLHDVRRVQRLRPLETGAL